MESYGEKLQNYDQPPPMAADWLRSQIGDFGIVNAFRTGGRRNAVWRVRNQRGDFVYKLHNRRSHWETEVFAYRQWRSAFVPFAAEVLAEARSEQYKLYGLLLSFVDGSPLREAGLESVAELAVYRRAGALLRRLHDLGGGRKHGRPGIDGSIQGGGRDTAEWASDVAGSLRQLADKGTRLNCLSTDHLALIHRASDLAETLSGEPVVPTHWDYTPGNWLVNSDGQFVAVIDFENMSWGHPADPMARLVLDYSQERPDRIKAFNGGYGEDLAAKYPDHLWIGCLIYAAYYAIAGAELRDAHHRERSARAFRIAAGYTGSVFMRGT